MKNYKDLTCLEIAEIANRSGKNRIDSVVKYLANNGIPSDIINVLNGCIVIGNNYCDNLMITREQVGDFWTPKYDQKNRTLAHCELHEKRVAARNYTDKLLSDFNKKTNKRVLRYKDMKWNVDYYQEKVKEAIDKYEKAIEEINRQRERLDEAKQKLRHFVYGNKKNY